MSRTCVDCRKSTGKPLARYCDGCRWKHRGKPCKYVWTPERDAIVRERYTGRKGNPEAIAKSIGFPAWAIRKRASHLGATQPKPWRDWTATEVAFLESHAGERHVNWIARKLGRSLASVVMKLKHERMSRAVRNGYTVRELELCFGVDHRVIERWANTGRLKVERRGYEGRNPWAVSDAALWEFVSKHPTAFDLRRVDQVWFMNLVLTRGREVGGLEQIA